MSAKCFSLVGAPVARVTRLDGCGRILYGDCAQVITDGFTSLAFTALIDEGEAVDVKNAGGKRCVFRRAKKIHNGYSVDAEFCQVDPDVYAMWTQQTVVLDPATGMAVGFRVNTDVDDSDAGIALEVWSDSPGQACGDTGGSFGYLGSFFLQGGVVGDFTLENDAVTFTLTGATTQDNPQWGVGPYNVVTDASGDPGPLNEPIGPKDHLHVQWTSVPPPTPVCGCIPLDDPLGVPATGATSGQPGTWTPPGSNRPDTLADTIAAAITASPLTPWTPTQRVITESGAPIQWDGTAWIAWVKP